MKPKIPKLVTMSPGTTWEELSAKLNLWGNPVKMGKNKGHIYGCQRGTWIETTIEVTDKYVVILVESGNEQALAAEMKRLWPENEIYIGDKIFEGGT